MGFKQDTREELDQLDGRVTALENLARQIQRTGLTPGSRPVREENRAETVVVGTPAATGVDYGAVAFGLSEIKRRVSQLVGGTSASESELATEYRGTVRYFSDVFAKSDPGFDADAFAEQANA